MKTKNSILLLLAFLSLSIFSQNDRKVLHGKIINDSLSVNKIHVVNKTSNKGTYTNTYGDFSISVMTNDTLVFSSLQFESYKYVISKTDLQKLQLVFKLNPMVNELEEVIVKSVNVAKSINLPNADKKPLNRTENRLNAHNKSKTPVVVLAALLNQRGGIDNLYYILSGKRKRDRKLQKIMQRDKIKKEDVKTVEKIKLYFKDDFFIDNIGIPQEKIDDFIDYCLKDSMITLFNEKRFLEIIELFIQERDQYLELIKE